MRIHVIMFILFLAVYSYGYYMGKKSLKETIDAMSNILTKEE